MFEIMTKGNSQTVTLNDNAGIAPTEQWVIAPGVKALWWAVASYARTHGIAIERVGYASREG